MKNSDLPNKVFVPKELTLELKTLDKYTYEEY